MVVSQIEALRMKVIGPSGFVRPDVPNPNALQDTLLNSNRDPNGANDLCIDLGYCSSTSQMAQKTFIINMIANKDLWEGTDIEKTIKTVVPPSFDPVDLEGGAGGEAAAAKWVKVKWVKWKCEVSEVKNLLPGCVHVHTVYILHVDGSTTGTGSTTGVCVHTVYM